MAEVKCREEPRDELDEALSLINQALQRLDAGGAPADIGAHLDHAKSRLEEVISSQFGN